MSGPLILEDGKSRTGRAEMKPTRLVARLAVSFMSGWLCLAVDLNSPTTKDTKLHKGVNLEGFGVAEKSMGYGII